MPTKPVTATLPAVSRPPTVPAPSMLKLAWVCWLVWFLITPVMLAPLRAGAGGLVPACGVMTSWPLADEPAVVKAGLPAPAVAHDEPPPPPASLAPLPKVE